MSAFDPSLPLLRAAALDPKQTRVRARASRLSLNGQTDPIAGQVDDIGRYDDAVEPSALRHGQHEHERGGNEIEAVHAQKLSKMGVETRPAAEPNDAYQEHIRGEEAPEVGAIVDVVMPEVYPRAWCLIRESGSSEKKKDGE